MKFMVTANQKPTLEIKMKRERNPNITLKKIIKLQGKQLKKEEKREELQKQPENNLQKGNKYIPINNHFKCQWIKCSNQKS